jgi:hypothetical protein
MADDGERTLAARLYNRTWELLELAQRRDAQTDELIHTAHASRFHWLAAAPAEPSRWARGEWLCSRVYAVLGRAEPAVWHARRCVAILETTDGAEDWDMAAACEAMARAHWVAGDPAEAASWKERGLVLAAAIADAEDRESIEADLHSLPG